MSEIFGKLSMKLFQGASRWNWALLDQALVSGSNFLVGIFLVRYLGFEQYGHYVIAWMFIQFMLSIQNSLISHPMLAISPKIPEREIKNYYAATFVFQLMLVAMVVAALLIFFLLPLHLKPSWLNLSLILPLTLCVISTQMQDYLRRNLFSRLNPKRAFCLDIIAYGTQLPVIIIVVREFPTFEHALFAVSASMSASVLVGLRWLNFSKDIKVNLHSVAKRHWISSKWLLGSVILQWMSNNYFLVVAATILGPSVVGAIRAAQNLLGLTHILFMGLENIIPGEASRSYQAGGYIAFFNYISRVGVLLAIVTGGVAMLAFHYAEQLLSMMYGAVDKNAVKAMLWFIPFYILMAISVPLKAGLRSLERTQSIFGAFVISSILSVLLADHFVSEYKVNGVMAGMVLVEVAACALLLGSLIKIKNKEVKNA